MCQSTHVIHGMTFFVQPQEIRMSSTEDKAKGKLNQAAGKVKEEVGDALGDGSMENRGKGQQVKGHVQEATGKIKESLRGKDD